MKKIILTLSLSFLFLCLSFSIHAQSPKASNFDEGVIIYELNVKGMPTVSESLNGTTFSVFFKGKQQKIDLSIMQGLARFQMLNNGEKKNTLLIDIPLFSEKSAIQIDPSSAEWAEIQGDVLKNQKPSKTEFKLEPNKKDKKKIAKYKCYRANVWANEPMGGASISLYISKDIRPATLDQFRQQMNWPELEGLPLGVEIKSGEIRLSLMAKEVKKGAVPSSTFDIPQNYQEKTLQELKDGIQEKIGGGTDNPGGVGM